MFSRHDLAWLTPAGWDAAPALPQWRARDWPAVVRRMDAGVAPGAVCLGIPLPERQRLALVVDAAAIARTAPPLPLVDAIAAAPPEWLAGLVALQRAAATLDLRVYGSLAMASITGLPYLRAASDIDLLLRPANRHDLQAGLALLEEYAQLLPLDGEIVFPSGDAVAWKEWLAACRDHARVLVKSLHAVRLANPAQLLETLPP
jgi:phosphoribosyl-dephospho-CoA transferase